MKKKDGLENIKFGNHLRKLRTSRGLSAEHVAMKAEVATSTYREWENGRAISGQPYIKLAEALSISLPHLFGLHDPHRDEVFACLEKIRTALDEIKRLL